MTPPISKLLKRSSSEIIMYGISSIAPDLTQLSSQFTKNIPAIALLGVANTFGPSCSSRVFSARGSKTSISLFRLAWYKIGGFSCFGVNDFSPGITLIISECIRIVKTKSPTGSKAFRRALNLRRSSQNRAVSGSSMNLLIRPNSQKSMAPAGQDAIIRRGLGKAFSRTVPFHVNSWLLRIITTTKIR